MLENMPSGFVWENGIFIGQWQKYRREESKLKNLMIVPRVFLSVTFCGTYGSRCFIICCRLLPFVLASLHVVGLEFLRVDGSVSDMKTNWEVSLSIAVAVNVQCSGDKLT